MNFLDTANVYGGKKGEGVTENLLDAWFAQGGRRDRVVVATKVYGTMGDGPNERGCSAYHIRAACEASLKRMRTDRIDLYQMHHIDRTTPWEEVWQAMDQLIAQGKVLYVGASNFAAWNIAEACMEAKARGSVGLVSEQSKYSLACRSIELEVLPACRRFGVGVIPWSPLDGGFLGGVLKDQGGVRRASDGMKKRIEASRAQLEALGRAVRQDRAASRRRGARLAAGAERRHRSDHRTTHHGAVRGRRARARDHPRWPGPDRDRPHLPGTGQPGARGLCLVMPGDAW